MKTYHIKMIFLYASLYILSTLIQAQDLEAAPKSLVSISSYTAQGKIPELKHALNEGLDAGLSINEMNETLVQLYAYCGFPRSLNAINT